MAFILRSNIHGLVSEFYPVPKAKACIIILDGLPSSEPSKKETMFKFAEYGYTTIAPRYRGTRESEGNFLDHNPAEDILELIRTIRTESLIDLYNNIPYSFQNQKIILMGISFGGLVALDCLEKVDGAILLSPLCDINFTHNLRDIEHFVKLGYGRAFNFSSEHWKDMLDGKLFKTDRNLIKKQYHKLAFLYDPSDSVILEDELLSFAREISCSNLYQIFGYGHLACSKFDAALYKLLDQIMVRFEVSKR